MGERPAFHIEITHTSSEPAGLRSIKDWQAQGLTFPRKIYPQVRDRKESEEFKGAGVYVLWNLPEFEKLPEVYVGEANRPLGRQGRITAHYTGTDRSWKGKNPWTHAVAFVGRDLNQTHAQYVEDKLYHLAEEAKRCTLDQRRPGHPSLSSTSDTAKAGQYLDSILLCFEVLGVNFFTKPIVSEKHPLLFLKSKSIQAQGYVTAQGFVVKANSQAVKEERASIHAYLSSLRKTLMERDVLKDAGSVFRLTQDYEFSSPSTASGVLLGMPSNGRRAWEDEKGIALADRATQATQEA